MKLTFTIIFVSFIIAGLVYGRMRVNRYPAYQSFAISSLLILVGFFVGYISYSQL